MDDIKFAQIKTEYDNFYRNLLSKGKLPMWSTEKGFWNASISDEVYAAFKKLNLEKYKNFLDIGSGDGKITLIASLFCKNAEGIEIDKFLHSKAVETRKKLDLNALFHNKDFLAHDLSQYDVMFMAPDSSMSRSIEEKLLKEMKGKLIHHGHHFHPKGLRKEKSVNINGNLFTLYKK